MRATPAADREGQGPPPAETEGAAVEPIADRGARARVEDLARDLDLSARRFKAGSAAAIFSWVPVQMKRRMPSSRGRSAGPTPSCSMRRATAPSSRSSSRLTAEVPSLALITYLAGPIDERYRAAIEPVLARAHIYNGDPFSDDYRRLSREEVNRALNECAVGLCLSRVEGAMYASIQYLLAWLPVVSTRSMGGRDEFFHPYGCDFAP